MIVRLGLNFGAHLLAGIAFGALAAYAAGSWLNERNRLADASDEEITHPEDNADHGSLSD